MKLICFIAITPVRKRRTEMLSKSQTRVGSPSSASALTSGRYKKCYIHMRIDPVLWEQAIFDTVPVAQSW